MLATVSKTAVPYYRKSSHQNEEKGDEQQVAASVHGTIDVGGQPHPITHGDHTVFEQGVADHAVMITDWGWRRKAFV
jgi:hypothetical protein